MTIDTNQISMEDTVTVGDKNAPVTIYEYINLRCPDSRRYLMERAPLLDDLVAKGQVKRVLKHRDVYRGKLYAGTLLNRYLPYGDDKKIYALIHHFTKHLDNWSEIKTEEGIQALAESKGLTEQPDADERHERMLAETNQLHIRKIPTVIVGDSVFEEEVPVEAFKQVVAGELKSHNIEL